MAQDGIELTRRRLLGGVATVGAVGAGAGAGTTALFSDTETSSSTLHSGTLDLTLDGQNSPVTLLSTSDIVPGDSGTESVTLANAGTVTGYVDVAVASATDYENGCPNGEQSVDSSCGTPGRNEGELDEHLELKATLGTQDLWNGDWLTPVEIYQNYGWGYDLDHPLTGGEAADFTLQWRLPSGTGRVVQSDSIEFTLTFSLDQQPDQGA